MIELAIPQLGDESKNAKDLVFSILTDEHSLSLMELYNKIKSKHNISITYQAVRKATEQLLENKILIKTGKKYRLSKEWVLKYKSFFDKLLTRESSGKKVNEFTTELAKENYAVYTLNSLLELDYFWGDILMYLPKHLKKDEPKNALMIPNYCWWMLINLGRETMVYENYSKIPVTFVFLKDNSLNKWTESIYKELGIKTKYKLDDKETVDIDVVGNTIIKVIYPQEIINRIKLFFEKYKTTQEMSMKEITEIAHKKCEIKLIIFKDKTVADNFRKLYL